MKKKQNKKNGFLITWSACIVLLLVLCFFGISDSMKGTQAKECYIYNGIEYCQNSAPSGFTGVVSKPSDYTPSQYLPGNSDYNGGGGSNDDDDYDDGPGSGSGSGSGSGYCSGVGGVSSEKECKAEGGVWVDGSDEKPSSGDGETGMTGDDKYNCSLDWVTCNSDGSYTTTIEGSNGETTIYYHDSDGNFVSYKTEYEDGSYTEYDYKTHITTHTNEIGTVTFYKTEDDCESNSGKKCGVYDGSYLTSDDAKTYFYNSKEACEAATLGECLPFNGDDTSVWISCDAKTCEDLGTCEEDDDPSAPITPSPAPVFPSTQPDLTPDDPSPGSSKPTSSNPSSSNPSSSNPNDRGDGCYRNKDTGEFKWFNSDPELNSQTSLYEKVDDSNCEPDISSNPKPSSSGNITENPQTGEIAIFLIWILGFGAVGYSVWYYIKSRKEN